jgi:hypothetical protein
MIMSMSMSTVPFLVIAHFCPIFNLRLKQSEIHYSTVLPNIRGAPAGRPCLAVAYVGIQSTGRCV